MADVLFDVPFLDALYFCVRFCIAFQAVHFCSKANELGGGCGASFGFYFAKDAVVFLREEGVRGIKVANIKMVDVLPHVVVNICRLNFAA